MDPSNQSVPLLLERAIRETETAYETSARWIQKFDSRCHRPTTVFVRGFPYNWNTRELRVCMARVCIHFFNQPQAVFTEIGHVVRVYIPDTYRPSWAVVTFATARYMLRAIITLFGKEVAQGHALTMEYACINAHSLAYDKRMFRDYKTRDF